jgi:hypothetical protein
VETQEIPQGEEERKEPELRFTFWGETVTYNDLCKRCRGACESYLKKIVKQSDSDDKEEAAEPKVASVSSI